MLGIGKTIIETNAVSIQDYIDWLANILKLTGLTLSSIFLFIFIFWLIINLLFSFLAEVIPFIKGILRSLELLLLPGSIMHLVMHVFVAKKLNMPSQPMYSFGYGWSRSGIKLVGRIKNLREAVLFYWAPLLNLPVIIVWVIPGMLLFQWLDTLTNNTIFYWIWLYVFFSLVMFGLPDMPDMINPFMVTIVKTPEFYLFIVFYVVIAPVTLVLWGYGITIILSLIFAITMFYEVMKISKKEENRLAKKFDKVFERTESSSMSKPTYIIVPDSEYTE
ncbi:MAG: hypothetical protein FK730_14510 [Asgard group archaeon]|nr:hypothetical protein [Asgard group archaeon]